MKFEAELAKIVTPLSKNNFRFLETHAATGGIYRRLYDGLRSGRFRDEYQVAAELCGSKPNSSTYRMLRMRFRRRALNTIFFLNLPKLGFSDYAHSIMLASREVFWVRILLLLGARNNAIKIAVQSLARCKKYHFTQFELDLLQFLRTHYALTGDRRNHEQYGLQIHKVLETYTAELQSSQMYETLAASFVRSGAAHLEVKQLAEDYLRVCRRFIESSDSYTLHTNYYRIATVYYQVSQQYPEILEVCEQAKRYCETHPELSNPIRLGEITLNMLECYLYLRDFDNGKLAANECANYFKVGSNSWFVYMEYYLLLMLHTSHFTHAGDVYESVTKHPRFTFQSDPRKARWQVFKMCLNYALQSSAPKPKRRSRDHKEASIPVYSKDKQGYNIPILIMQILQLLDAGRLDEIIERMEALRTYRSRYLRARGNRQSALFFRLLQVMESSGFSYEVTSQKANKTFKKLKATTADYTEIHEGIQILPYEWLWERVLERLKELNIPAPAHTASVESV